MTKITLEDLGQDFLWLMVNDDGRVIDAGPYQANIWRGAYIPLQFVRVGERCPIHHPPHIKFGYLRYRVTEIDRESNDENGTKDET